MRSSLLVCLIVFAPVQAWADGRGIDLHSPVAPEGAPHDGHRTTPMLDLSVTTLVPLSVGGAMHLDLLEGIFVRVGGSVVVPAYVDAINDIGRGYGLWDDGTAGAIDDVLVDALVIEACVGVRPLEGPLELSVGYFMLWSEGMGPAMLGLDDRSLSISMYAVHPELTARIPLGDFLIMRISAGWVHTLATDVRIGRQQTDDEAMDASRALTEEMLAGWMLTYGLGPTLSVSVGAHFQ